MHAVGPVDLQPTPEPIEEGPRHPVLAAGRAHIAQPLRVAQHAQTLTVYAVLEGHRSRPFHVSPPRETRGRIGRVALLASGGQTPEGVNTNAKQHSLVVVLANVTPCKRRLRSARDVHKSSHGSAGP